MYMKRIIVVGSGIVGASAAYQLVKKNVEVILIDKKQDGKATSAGAGIISPWTSRVENEDWYKIARGGAIFYPDLIEQRKQDGEEEVALLRMKRSQVWKYMGIKDRMTSWLCLRGLGSQKH